MNLGYSIKSSEELSTFCHELSKHVNVSASGIKSALAKMKGYGHSKGYVEALKAQETSSDVMSAREWMLAFDAFNPQRDTWTSRANVLLFFMLNCIKATRASLSDEFALSELVRVLTPLEVVRLGCQAYKRTNNEAFKSYIAQFIDTTPGGNFNSLYKRFESGDLMEIIPGTFTEQIGYMTMQIEPFLQERSGWQLLI